MLDTEKWQERLQLLRGEDMQKVYGCDGECKSLQIKIAELGELSRLKHYEGGRERLAEREREKKKDCKTFWQPIAESFTIMCDNFRL